MINKIKQISALLILVSVFSLFSACKKTPDKPHINPATAGGTLTISQLKTMFIANSGQNIKFSQDISLFVTVTMTDNYKTLYLRDQTGAICLKQLTRQGIFAGDSLRVNLNGCVLDQSAANSSIQIDSVDVSDSPTCKVVKLAVSRPTPPITVTIAQLNHTWSDTSFNSITGAFFVPRSIYDGQLVQINDVQFSFANRINFIPNGSPTYVTPTPILYDCGALTNIQVSLYSGTADFQNQPIPYNNSGSIIGAISFYNNALQITPRSFADVNFNQPRCGLQTLNQTFDTVLCGTGATLPSTTGLFSGWGFIRQVGYYQVWGGTTSGTIYYPSASVTYSSDTRNVEWMITPPIQNSPTKNINFQTTTTGHTVSLNNQLSVLVSTDYNGYNLTSATYGTQATWTDITAAFNIATTNFNFYTASPAGVPLSSTNASSLLSGYTGTFYVGFRYAGAKAVADSAASYGINNVVIKN